MRKAWAILDIFVFVFFMALVGIKRANDFAPDPGLYPYVFWGSILLMVIATWNVLFPLKKKKR